MLTEVQLRRICARCELPNINLNSLPDSYQWAAVLRGGRKHMQVAEQVMGLKFFPGALFTGPAGNGRHTTAYALANTLLRDKDGYKGIIGVHCDDLDCIEREDVFTVLERIVAIARECGSLILLYEQREESQNGTLFQRFILRSRCALEREGIPFYLIVVADSDDALSDEMMSSVPRYHCPAPDKKTVSQWTEKMMQTPVPIKIENKTPADIARVLQGKSWKQLSDLHNNLLRLIVLKYAMNKAKFDKLGLTEKAVYEEGRITLAEDAVTKILVSTAKQRQKKVMANSMMQMSDYTHYLDDRYEYDQGDDVASIVENPIDRFKDKFKDLNNEYLNTSDDQVSENE